MGFVIDGDLEDVKRRVLRSFFLASQKVAIRVALGPEDQSVACVVSFGAAVVGATEDGQQAPGKIALEAILLAVPVLMSTNDHRQLVCLLRKMIKLLDCLE